MTAAPLLLLTVLLASPEEAAPPAPAASDTAPNAAAPGDTAPGDPAPSDAAPPADDGDASPEAKTVPPTDTPAEAPSPAPLPAETPAAQSTPAEQLVVPPEEALPAPSDPAATAPPAAAAKAPPPPEQGSAADQALEACLAPGLPSPEVTACLEAVQRDHPDTLAAGKAATALSVLTVTQTAEEPGFGLMPAFLKPGYLELATVGGVYGIWAGVTGGILTATNVDQYQLRIDPWAILLGGGIGAVTLGLAGAGAGYAAASAVNIDRGYAWSFTAGMTWGLSYAISIIPAVYDVAEVPWYIQDELNFGLPLLGGGLGAVTGFGLAHMLRPDIAEVSMMNTGGWIGGAYGLIVGINASVWGPNNLKYGLLNATSYSVGKTLGLVAGAGASQLLRYTWGETLLGDFGAVLGIILFGAGAGAFVTSPVAEPWLCAVVGKRDPELFGKIATTTISASIGAGMALGLASTTAGLVIWHNVTGAPVLRDDTLPFKIAPLVSVAPSMDGQSMAPVYGVAASW